MSLNNLDAALAAIRCTQLRNADPLANLRLIPKQHAFLEAVAGCDEAALRAANKLGKSTVAAYVIVAMLRGLPSLRGVRLPQMRYSPPPVAWVLTRTYKQQVEGTQAAVMLALGNWPHEIIWQDRGEGTWAGVRIKPDRSTSNDPTAWAKLSFVSQQNSRNDADVAKGARLDAAWFDEPGYPAVVAELRKAGRPGQPFRMLHTFTPLLRDEWEPIRRDIESPLLGIREVTASIYDAIRGRVENGFLSEEEVATLERKYSTDQHRDARLFGHYCDVAGSSPWSRRAMEVLNEWLNRCEPGKLVPFELRGERDTAEGRGIVTEQVEVEVWWEPEQGEEYLLVADPAEGIEDGEHDPLALVVVATRKPRVVAAYSGFVSPHGLGNLGGQLARQYRNALVEPETQGGWGGPFLTGLRSARYYRVGQDTVPMSPGKYRSVLGFKTTDQTRPLYFSALHQAMLEDSVTIPSRSIVSQLMGIELDRRGRPAARYGEHDEYAICLGRALYRLANMRSVRSAPRPETIETVIQRVTDSPRRGPARQRANWIDA